MITLIMNWIQASHGPHGIVIWIQPPHISAGIGIIRDHLVTWWEVSK